MHQWTRFLLAKEVIGNRMFVSFNYRDKMVALETTDMYGTLMSSQNRYIDKMPLAIMNLHLHRDNVFSVMGQFYDIQTRLS